MLLENSAVLAQDHAAPKPAVQRGLVHDNGILNVVARVGHDRHSGVLARPQLVKADQLNGLGGQQRPASELSADAIWLLEEAERVSIGDPQSATSPGTRCRQEYPQRVAC